MFLIEIQWSEKQFIFKVMKLKRSLFFNISVFIYFKRQFYLELKSVEKQLEMF